MTRGQNSASSSLRFTNSEHVSNDTRVRLSSVSPASKTKTLVLETNLNGIPRFCIVDTGASVSSVFQLQLYNTQQIVVLLVLLLLRPRHKTLVNTGHQQRTLERYTV